MDGTDMISKRQKLFAQEQSLWWGMPMGPSWPLRQAYNQIPFVIRPTRISNYGGRNVRNGRGMLVWIEDNHPANTPFVVRHNLGRRVTAAMMISNNDGAAYPGRMILTGQTRTLSEQSIACDNVLQRAYVWMF